MPALAKPRMAAALAGVLTTASGYMLIWGHPAAGSLTPGHWEVINICRFQPVRFGSNPSKQEITNI